MVELCLIAGIADIADIARNRASAEKAKAYRGLTRMNADQGGKRLIGKARVWPRRRQKTLKPTPNWDQMGCGGMPRAGRSCVERGYRRKRDQKTHRQECRCHTEHWVIAVIGKANLATDGADSEDVAQLGMVLGSKRVSALES